MKKTILTFISIVIFLSGCSGCVYGIFHPFRVDGPYKGRIVDADTRQPVEGVVVLGTWSKVYPNVAGATHEFYDARETVTDKNGDFLIDGLGLRLFSNVEAMNVLIFKSGYEYLGTMPWNTLRVDSTMLQKVKWEDGKVILPLKKLTMEERKKQGTPDMNYEKRIIDYTINGLPIHSLFIPKKVRLIIKEINKDLLEQGKKPLAGE